MQPSKSVSIEIVTALLATGWINCATDTLSFGRNTIEGIPAAAQYAILGIFLVLAGIAGAVLPILPGAPLVFLGLLCAAWADHFQKVGWFTLTVLGILTLLSFGVDFLAKTYGAKRVGASWLALAGAMFLALGLFVSSMVRSQMVAALVSLVLSLPFIVTGLRLALGRGLIGMVLADLYTAISGIGYLIVRTASTYQVNKMFVPIVTLGLLGVTLTAILRVVEKRVAPWTAATEED